MQHNANPLIFSVTLYALHYHSCVWKNVLTTVGKGWTHHINGFKKLCQQYLLFILKESSPTLSAELQIQKLPPTLINLIKLQLYRNILWHHKGDRCVRANCNHLNSSGNQSTEFLLPHVWRNFKQIGWKADQHGLSFTILSVSFTWYVSCRTWKKKVTKQIVSAIVGVSDCGRYIREKLCSWSEVCN